MELKECSLERPLLRHNSAPCQTLERHVSALGKIFGLAYNVLSTHCIHWQWGLQYRTAITINISGLRSLNAFGSSHALTVFLNYLISVRNLHSEH